MKVRINYSIELEDVPLEVGRLYNMALKKLQANLDGLDEADIENPTDFVSRVSKFRTEMEGLDAQLAECQGIMQGYLKTIVGSENKQEVIEDVPEDG